MNRFLAPKSSENEKGNILFYILLCVVLLAGLSFVMSQNSGDTASGMSASKISEEIKTQAQTIRSAVLECNLVHNFGYPTQPASTFAKDLRCQTDTVPNYEDIFSGTANRVLPLPPGPFTTGWKYLVNGGTTPPTITLELTDLMNCDGNQGLKSALSILTTQYTPAEITTTCSGATASVIIYIVKGV